MTTQIVSVDSTTSKLQVGGVDAFSFTTAGITAPKFTGALNGSLGATTPSTVAATTISASTGLALGSAPQTGNTGEIGFPNAAALRWRNGANSAYLNAMYVDASNNQILGGSAVNSVIQSVAGVGTITTASSTGLAVTGALSASSYVESSVATGGGSGYVLGGTGTVFGGIYEDSADSWNLGYSSTRTSAPTSVLNWNKSGNAGLGVPPSAWTSYKALELGGVGHSVFATAGVGSEMNVSCNAYFNAGFKYAFSDKATMYTQTAGVHQWSIAGAGTAGNPITFTQAMTLDASGNLLVGTTSATDTVVGVRVKYSAVDPYIVCTNTASTSVATAYNLYSTGAAAYRFYVDLAGTVHATSTSITAISDVSLKENIRDLETGLTEVMALKPRRYDWKNGDGTNIAGFVAQELETVLPDLVFDSKYNETETKKSIKMGDILPTLVKAIQEQQAQIAALTQRLTILENK